MKVNGAFVVNTMKQGSYNVRYFYVVLHQLHKFCVSVNLI